jgi:glycosyltransferase involved in cell wall biosynthesis
VRALEILGDAGARVAVAFHDVEPYGGGRVVDRLRRASQLRTMRGALHLADLGIFTVALHTISWLGDPPANARFIPVGANLPPEASGSKNNSANRDLGSCVAVFGITGGLAGNKECDQIVSAMSFAAGKLGRVRLHAFGRGVIEHEAELQDGLRGTAVDLSIDGVLPAERVAEALRAADVMLFVREPISSRRGSAIAGISSGLPLVCFGGEQTAEPVTEAGVVLVSREKPGELGNALVRVLGDDEYRAGLASRSRAAYREHFSWDAIAVRYLAALDELG